MDKGVPCHGGGEGEEEEEAYEVRPDVCRLVVHHEDGLDGTGVGKVGAIPRAPEP